MRPLAVVLLFGCATARPDVADSLAAYRQSVLDMNVDASVALMASDVSVGHGDAAPVVGRDKVAAFLKTFAAYKVTAYTLHADATAVAGDVAKQHGTWAQDVTTPDGQAVHVSGVFDAEWHWDHGHWLIYRMHTAN